MRKIKIWKLKDNEKRELFKKILGEKIACSGDGEWKNLEENILNAGKEICLITSGKREEKRETWWWNDAVLQRLREKKVAYKRWQQTGVEEDRETFKERKRVARREIAIAKREAKEEWSRNLNTAEGSGKMFRIAKQIRKDKRDVVGIFFIKSDTGGIKVARAEVCQRWKEYFEALLNGENESELEVEECC